MALTEHQIKMANESFLQKIKSGDPEQIKQAADSLGDYTRYKVRESAIWTKVLPPDPISDEELDRDENVELGSVIVDMEPDSTGAVSIGYNSWPTQLFVRQKRYRVKMHRIVTQEVIKDVAELRTARMDFRQFIADSQIKDLAYEEDRSFFLDGVDAAIGVAANNTPTCTLAELLAGTKLAQHVSVPWSNGLTRDSFADALKVLPSQPAKLETSTVIVNHIAIKDLLKMEHDEVGGPLSQEWFVNGWQETTIMGVKVIVTNKTDIVKHNEMYIFSDPRYLGKAYVLQEPTLRVDVQSWFLMCAAYTELGAGIGNRYACAKVRFQNS